jgi:hypothetical protein
MKTLIPRFFAALLALCSLNASATTHYVDASGTNATPPYTDWTTAAVNIQDAIDASTNGDIVLVTNGVYAGGGQVMTGTLTNRVALTSAITVQSVNGPWVTTIQGAGATNGPSAVRCAWLTNNATLIGFTLKWGATASTDDNGGGVWCASSNALVNNCVIVSNTAYTDALAGAVYRGTLNNCLISSNLGIVSSAVCIAFLNSCTVVSNTGGILSCVLTNCIIFANQPMNIDGSVTAAYCCIPPYLEPGTGNFTNAPQLFADGVHLLSNSPCIGAGTNLVTGTDIFGKPWANPPSVGCAEFAPSTLVTHPSIALTSDPVGFEAVNVSVAGQPPFAFSWLKDGVPLQDNGHFSATQTANFVATGVSLADAGDYQLVVSNTSDVVTSAVAQLVVLCVDAAGTNPVAPYSAWATAATNIQDAITASFAGEIVLVTNGLYATGGKSMDGVLTNRVSLDKAILVQSVNGPGVTVIQGALDPTSTNGPAAVRCAWLTNNATLSGFTFRGGATQAAAAEGGGVYGASVSATVYNCVLATNYASYSGGGAYQAAIHNSILLGNEAVGSRSFGGGLGGGAAKCNLRNCFIISNSANLSTGGGVDTCNLTNCSLTQNSSYLNGGAANSGSLLNCTVTENTSGHYTSGYGAAVYGAVLTNCIVWGNSEGTTYPNTNYASSTLAYCCSYPLPAGVGNIAVNPQLLSDGVHLSATSPCIGAGTNVAVGTDIDGQPWNNPPSIGCDEWYPSPIILAQPAYQVAFSTHSLLFNIAVAGQAPFTYVWTQNGVPVQDNGHYLNSGSSNLVVNNFGPDDAGTYEVVVSNAFGMATSAVVQLVIHAVDAAGTNPEPPFLTWDTAATNIQDAINAASAGDIVLVTNGLYATGGQSMDGVITNRVAMSNALLVVSVNGWANTVIQGAWDPVSTNGPAAVRCAWLTNGAVLSGFALQNGATRNAGNSNSLSGGGVWCASSNALVSYCLLTNNAAPDGGGIAFGTLNNSLVVNNVGTYGGGSYYATLNNCLVVSNLAAYGGGAYNSTLNNCTVVDNSNAHNPLSPVPTYGAGTYYGLARNCIVLDNYDHNGTSDNYVLGPGEYSYSYSCTYGFYGEIPEGAGNTNADPQFVDYYQISIYSPCRGAGSALYATGTDFNGQPWNNPPSMGCAEVVVSNRVGPLSVALTSSVVGYPPQTNVLVGHDVYFLGAITGLPSYLAWNFGDGPDVTNADYYTFHAWTNAGVYNVVLTAYNDDNPAGVSTNTTITVVPVNPPELQSVAVLSNSFQFQFAGQVNANYTVQYATNLTPPVHWMTSQSLPPSVGNVSQITITIGTNATGFYRVLAQ